MDTREKIADTRSLAEVFQRAEGKLPETVKAEIIGRIEGALSVQEAIENRKVS